MTRARVESIRGFLVCVSSTYKFMTPYPKGVYLTMDRWIPYRYKERFRLLGEALKMAGFEGKWERIEEVDKPTLVMVVPRLKYYLLAMGRLTEEQTLPWIQLRSQIQAFDYLVGDASVLGLWSVLWGQGKLVSESGEFTPLYQGRSSKF